MKHFPSILSVAVLLFHTAAQCFVVIRPPTTRIALRADISITQPSPDEAAGMGIRDWPQQSKSGVWEETCSDGETLVRYVLDGTGSIVVGDEKEAVAPGTLIEVTGETQLSWKASSDEMIILTPSFEEGGKLAIVAGGLILISIALIAGVGS